jgi:TonB-linked SusC/RagA family outer membrane protein
MKIKLRRKISVDIKRIMKMGFLSLLAGVMSLQMNAQQGIKVSGLITDNSGELLSAVNVSIRGTTQGVMTDDKGEYSLTVPSDTTVLIFSSVGYQTQQIKVGSRRIIAIILKEDAEDLGDVTIVAFGTQKKSSVIDSITTVNPAELKIPSSNLTTALAGRLAGMIAYQRSGEPGLDNATFFIRGVTTFGYKKDPLILIDNNESNTSDLARLQPDEISSFSIMKDATATALYGSRGANGVILVATKSGIEGPARLDIRFEESFSQPTSLPKLADPISYMRLHNEAVLTRKLNPAPYSQNDIMNRTDPNRNPYVYPVNDWHDLLFKDFANNMHLNFSVSGGGKVARYYVAGSLIKDNGVLKTDKLNNFNSNVALNRYTLRANTNINLTSTTEMIARLSGAFDNYHGPMNGGSAVFNQVMNSNPVLFPAYYAPDKNNELTKHILFGGATNASGGFYNNPYADMVRGYKDSNTTQVNIQFELKQNLNFITEGLTLRGMFNTNYYGYFDISRAYSAYYYNIPPGSYDKYEDKYTLYSMNEGEEWLSFKEGPKNQNTSIYFESTLNWDRTFGKHSLGALLVYTMRELKETQTEGGTDLQKSLPYRNIGLAGRATYAYDGRYLVEFNFGYNGSERFSKNERFGFFPSAGLGWVVSKEHFWNDDLLKVISNLKIKGTYGLVGNDAIGDSSNRFYYISNVNPADGNYGSYFGTYGNTGFPGFSIGRYANENITWEQSAKSNLAIELGLFEKIDLQVEIYKEHRTNIMMLRSSIPRTMGLQVNQEANVGEAESKGVDISLNIQHSFNKDFWIQVMSNFTYATSKFLKYEEPAYSDAPWKSRVGYSLNQNWGYIAERLFLDEDEIKNSPTQFGQYMAGDIKYLDLNKDGQITELDMAPIGYPTSPEIVYGFGASTGYKSWDFSFFFQGLARESFWIDYSATSPFIDGQRALLKAYADDHWSEDNRNAYALWPRLSPTVIENNSPVLNNNRVPTTWFMRDGSFLRLKSVELGYTLPEKLFSKAKMSNFRVYVSGTNLLTFSKFKLWDPEMAGSGLDYPVQRVFNVGLQLSF